MAVNKKIILFDSWTKGSRHIFRLLNELENRSIQIKLIHVGSWGDEKGRPLKESINGLEVYDIQYYGSLKKVLEIEKPDLVFFLSLDVLIHRAFNRYCRNLDIATVNLYHGVHSVFYTLDSKSRSLFSLWKGLIGRSYNMFRYTLFTYILALIHTKASFITWIELFVDVFRKIAGKAVVIARDDSLTDYICVLNKFDQLQAKEKYRITEDKITVVGNPDILKFDGLKDELAKYSHTDNHDMEYITYIGSGARSTNLVLVSDDDYFNHLMSIYRATKKIQKTLILKLHYSRESAMKNMFEKNNINIEISNDYNFVQFLKNSCFAISEPSTAALVPAFMGKPLFLAQYGLLSSVAYGVALTSYPRAYFLKDLKYIENMMDQDRELVNNDRIDDWINLSTQPLPLDKMPSRVVNVFEKAISYKRV